MTAGSPVDLDRPGFADPVLGTQACFRALLSALSRPGSVHRVGAGLPAPAPLGIATAAVLLTLVDAETSCWITPALAQAHPWIAFHCGVAAAPLSAARFVVATELPDLAILDRGSDAAPEDSATVILQIAALGDGPVLRLTGPGLAAPAALRVRGLPENFARVWHDNHALYPRGVDILLCAGDRLAALPRTVAIEAA